MGDIHQTKAIILRKIAYKEGDWILTLLTEEGTRLTAFAPYARQSKKRFNGSIDLFNEVHVICKKSQGKEAFNLDSCELVHGMETIRQDLPKFAMACYLAELLLVFLQEGGQPMPQLFKTFKGYFDTLNGQNQFYPQSIPFMEYHLLEIFGYKPVLHHCVRCQKVIDSSNQYYFCGIQGGVLCTECAKNPKQAKTHSMIHDQYPLSYAAMRTILTNCSKGPQVWNQEAGFNSRDFFQVRKALEYFIQYTIGRPLKSLQFLSDIIPFPITQ